MAYRGVGIAWYGPGTYLTFWTGDMPDTATWGVATCAWPGLKRRTVPGRMTE